MHLLPLLAARQKGFRVSVAVPLRYLCFLLPSRSPRRAACYLPKGGDGISRFFHLLECHFGPARARPRQAGSSGSPEPRDRSVSGEALRIRPQCHARRELQQTARVRLQPQIVRSDFGKPIRHGRFHRRTAGFTFRSGLPSEAGEPAEGDSARFRARGVFCEWLTWASARKARSGPGCLKCGLRSPGNRNADRFPGDFMFQLTAEEHEALKCQIGTSSDEDLLFPLHAQVRLGNPNPRLSNVLNR